MNISHQLFVYTLHNNLCEFTLHSTRTQIQNVLKKLVLNVCFKDLWYTYKTKSDYRFGMTNSINKY